MKRRFALLLAGSLVCLAGLRLEAGEKLNLLKLGSFSYATTKRHQFDVPESAVQMARIASSSPSPSGTDGLGLLA